MSADVMSARRSTHGSLRVFAELRPLRVTGAVGAALAVGRFGEAVEGVGEAAAPFFAPCGGQAIAARAGLLEEAVDAEPGQMRVEGGRVRSQQPPQFLGAHFAAQAFAVVPVGDLQDLVAPEEIVEGGLVR